jgi:hypothetical protein
MSILVLTSDTLSSPAAAGQIEYTSPIFAATPIGTQRGIVPTQQYYRLNADLAGANVATAQSIFNVGCTLSASTVYEFEALYGLIKSAGTTSHTLGFGFGGTATVNNILYEASGGIILGATASGTLLSGASGLIGSIANSITSTVVFTAITTAAISFSHIVRGTVSINAGGTFIPQYTCSAAPGGAYTTVAGSFIRINPLSASGAATNVGTWA